MIRFILSCIIICCCSVVNARMYQWVDPDNGTTQLSGKPPVWYRSEDGGPRVFVFENGKVIDDTGISVSASERDRLRLQSFLKAEEDKTAAKEKLLQAKRFQALLDQERGEEEELVELQELDTEIDMPAENKPLVSEEDTIEEMRALIDEWEMRRARSARELVNPTDPS